MHDIGSFEVRFWHDREVEATTTQVYDKVLDRTVEATVEKHSKDKFEYRKARKFALTKAVAQWPRVVRVGFWREYKLARPQDLV